MFQSIVFFQFHKIEAFRIFSVKMWASENSNKFLLVPQSGIVKNIVYEILRECDKQDFVCEKKFVTFVVHLISLRFKDDARLSEKFDRKTIEELIEICLKIIIGTNRIKCWD